MVVYGRPPTTIWPRTGCWPSSVAPGSPFGGDGGGAVRRSGRLSGDESGERSANRTFVDPSSSDAKPACASMWALKASYESLMYGSSWTTCSMSSFCNVQNSARVKHFAEYCLGGVSSEYSAFSPKNAGACTYAKSCSDATFVKPVWILLGLSSPSG